MKVLVAIDPGQGGGIVWRDGTGAIGGTKMPETPADIWSVLGALHAVYGIVERVGGYMPGNSGPASVKFARHCGRIDMAMIGQGIPHIFVAPQVWMKWLLTTVPKEKVERKNAIKAEVQRRVPGLKITLATSDALGMLLYLMKDPNVYGGD